MHIQLQVSNIEATSVSQVDRKWITINSQVGHK